MSKINKTGLCKECGVKLNAKDKRTQYCIKCAHTGSRNAQWKGDKVGIDALHTYIRKRLDKPEKCLHCNEAPPIDLANKSGKYKRDVSDWEWLCRRCHMKSDGRLDNFLLHSNMHNKIPNRNCIKCGKEFVTRYNSRKFCSRSCSASFNNLKRDYSNRKSRWDSR